MATHALRLYADAGLYHRYYALMSYLGIHFIPKEMSQFGFFQILH